jgi:hypothetical protein
MTARRSPCTMRMTLFRGALLLVDNLILLSFFKYFGGHFQSRASAAIANIRASGTRPQPRGDQRECFLTRLIPLAPRLQLLLPAPCSR